MIELLSFLREQLDRLPPESWGLAWAVITLAAIALLSRRSPEP